MPDSPPRLDTGSSSQSGYAPISWTAVASLGVAILFLVILTALGISAAAKKEPLLEDRLLILPAVGVVLAFTARRQILNSEGTRTGERLASAGWWLSVVGGVVYVAYLFGTEFAIRFQAEQQFVAWANTVKEIDPANPRDPKLYEAVLITVPPRSRSQVKGAKDTETADKVFREELSRLRQLDIIRIAGRNRQKVEFTDFGVKAWEQSGGKITCTLSCKMISPEGEHTLVVPMQAELDKSGRKWQVSPGGSGFAVSRELTRYGWIVEQLENSGRQFADQFLMTAAAPGQQGLAYQLFVRNEDEINGSAAAIFAGLAAVIARDHLGYETALAGPLLTGPDGAPLSADDRVRFRQYWDHGRFRRPGATLRDSPDINPVLRLTEDGVELKVPIEINLSAGLGATTEAARGKILLRATDPGLVKELASARDAKSDLTPQPPADLLSKSPSWRVVRIESDLKSVPVSPPPGAPGEGGPVNMMMGE